MTEMTPWGAWFAVIMVLSPYEPASPAPVCERLVEHLGDAKVAQLNKGRGDAPDLVEVCTRVAREARRQDLDPAMAVSVAYAESGLRWKPGGRGTFLGPMQVGRRWCKMPWKGCVPDGVKHLLVWREKSKSWNEALWGYVGGHARKLSRRAKKRKRGYVKRVMEMQRAIAVEREGG